MMNKMAQNKYMGLVKSIHSIQSKSLVWFLRLNECILIFCFRDVYIKISQNVKLSIYKCKALYAHCTCGFFWCKINESPKNLANQDLCPCMKEILNIELFHNLLFSLAV